MSFLFCFCLFVCLRTNSVLLTTYSWFWSILLRYNFWWGSRSYLWLQKLNLSCSAPGKCCTCYATSLTLGVLLVESNQYYKLFGLYSTFPRYLNILTSLNFLTNICCRFEMIINYCGTNTKACAWSSNWTTIVLLFWPAAFSLIRSLLQKIYQYRLLVLAEPGLIV